MAGVDLQHIPYKGSSPALTDLVAGQVVVFIGNMPPTVPLVKAGKLRALAVTTKTRSALMPELPTISEAGLPGYETVAWFGVLAPARHAAGRRQPPLAGDRQDREVAGDAREAAGDGRGAGRQHARGVQGRDRPRHREVEAARAEGRHQGGLTDRAHGDASRRSTPIVVNVSPKTNWTFVEVTADRTARSAAASARSTAGSRCSSRRRRCSRATRVGATLDDAGDARALPAALAGRPRRACGEERDGAGAHRPARGGGGNAHGAACSPAMPRAAVPAYANINRSVTDRAPAGFADAARRAVAAGYRAVKLAPFDGVIAQDAAHTPIDARTRDGLDRVFAVRDAVGPRVAVMVDCHWRFDVDARGGVIARHRTRAAVLGRMHDHRASVGIRRRSRGSRRSRTSSGIAHGGRRDDRRRGRRAGDVRGQALRRADARHQVRGRLRRHARDRAACAPTTASASRRTIRRARSRTSRAFTRAPRRPTLLMARAPMERDAAVRRTVGRDLPALRDGAFVVPSASGLGTSLDRDVVRAHPYRALARGANLDERLG